MSLNTTNKTFIKVFWTKTNHFRAWISEPNQEPYEVTVGGESWNRGKGNDHATAIFERMTILSQKIQRELQFQLKFSYLPIIKKDELQKVNRTEEVSLLEETYDTLNHVAPFNLKPDGLATRIENFLKRR